MGLLRQSSIYQTCHFVGCLAVCWLTITLGHDEISHLHTGLPDDTLAACHSQRRGEAGCHAVSTLWLEEPVSRGESRLCMPTYLIPADTVCMQSGSTAPSMPSISTSSTRLVTHRCRCASPLMLSIKPLNTLHTYRLSHFTLLFLSRIRIQVQIQGQGRLDADTFTPRAALEPPAYISDRHSSILHPPRHVSELVAVPCNLERVAGLEAPPRQPGIPDRLDSADSLEDVMWMSRLVRRGPVPPRTVPSR